jgi:hypothetical protein
MCEDTNFLNEKKIQDVSSKRHRSLMKQKDRQRGNAT